jgi:ribosomal protein L20A (L18A)
LNKAEVKLLNAIYNPSNNFFNIEYCGLEIIKLYIAVISALVNKYIEEETSIDEQFEAVSDIIARKQFRYRKGSQNYKFCIENSPNEFFSHIFKCCENEVRELYNHKRKLNTDNYCSNVEANTEFETKISSKVNDLISILISKVSKPDETTEIELYSQNTSRWKIKFEQLTINYNNNPQEFINSIISLGKLNKNNPSVENIFFEASKFIAKYNNESALFLYIHYLNHDLKSATFDNKQHTKTIQKSLFKTNDQLHDFEKIVSELIKDKDLEKALKQIPEIYKVKRKKIQLNRDSIKEVIEQHTETVELLNEYLKDDFEDENNSIKSQEISNEEIQIEIIQKSEEVHQSAFLSELTFTAIHTTALELFAKSNFSVSQSEFEIFAKSKGVFKNQLIESINDTCYEFLDDVLIEEEDDYYTINTNYFQRISTK